MADANTSLEQQKVDQEQIDQLAMEQTTAPLSSDETVDATSETPIPPGEERQNFVRGEQGLDTSELAEGEVASIDTGIVEITSSEVSEEGGTADIAAADITVGQVVPLTFVEEPEEKVDGGDESDQAGTPTTIDPGGMTTGVVTAGGSTSPGGQTAGTPAAGGEASAPTADAAPVAGTPADAAPAPEVTLATNAPAPTAIMGSRH